MDARYERYKDWKNWGGDIIIPNWLSRYYEKEIKRARLPRFESVLEIGFGNGEFLYWAQSQGVSAVGLEINPDFVEAALCNK